MRESAPTCLRAAGCASIPAASGSPSAGMSILRSRRRAPSAEALTRLTPISRWTRRCCSTAVGLSARSLHAGVRRPARTPAWARARARQHANRPHDRPLDLWGAQATREPALASRIAKSLGRLAGTSPDAHFASHDRPRPLGSAARTCSAERTIDRRGEIWRPRHWAPKHRRAISPAPSF